MMMAYGYFIFARQTLPYQSQQHTLGWRHPENSRVGARPASQFVGPDAERISLSGVLHPELTGGRLSLELVRKMADTGKGYPLLDGTGVFYGIYVIESMASTRTEFNWHGEAKRIEFQIELKRVDDKDRGLFGYLNMPDIDLGTDWGGLLS